MNDLRSRKAKHVFNLFDANGDGCVERADIDKIIDRVAETLGHYVGSTEYSRIQDLYSRLWRELLPIDTNFDGRVSLDEWLATVETIAGTVEMHPTLLNRIVSSIFDLFDTNFDGEISGDEYISWLVANGCGGDEAADAFLKLDTNGDGRLSTEEINQLAKEYLFGETPDQPGNWLFGAI